MRPPLIAARGEWNYERHGRPNQPPPAREIRRAPRPPTLTRWRTRGRQQSVTLAAAAEIAVPTAAATPAAAPSATEAAAAPATSARLLRTGFVHDQVAAIDGLAVEFGDGGLRLR